MIQGRKQNGADFLKRAATTASHYGFLPFTEVSEKALHSRGGKKERLFPVPNSAPLRSTDLAGTEFTKTLRVCGEQGLLSRRNPFLFFHTTLDFVKKGASPKSDFKSFSFGLQAYGANQSSVGEAVVLKASLSILEEGGHSDMQVYVNSIGDKDSTARFGRELASNLRKRIADLPAPAEVALKTDPMEAFLYLIKKEHPIVEELPRPVEFLSAASRRHFREVLEQLEATGIPYELDDTLMGGREYYTETVFEIRQRVPEGAAPSEPATSSNLRIRGGRYDELSKRMFKTAIPAVGIIFSMQNPGNTITSAVAPIRVKAPKVYFVHLGTEAKRHSISVIETLRKAHIPFHHSIAESGFSSQISEAERLSIPYLIIMGQKEAVESSVIVRNIGTRAQQTVRIDALPTYLKMSRA